MARITHKIAALAVGLLLLTAPVFAQNGDTPPAAPIERTPISLELKDAPIRSALESIFKQAHVDYVIDNDVAGYVTMKVTALPFEDAMKLVMRSATPALTYTKDNGVYIVKVRQIVTGAPGPLTPPSFEPAVVLPSTTLYETLSVVYIDPYDLKDLLKITFIPIGSRHGLNGMGAGIIGGQNGSGNGTGTGNGNRPGGNSGGPGDGGGNLIPPPSGGNPPGGRGNR